MGGKTVRTGEHENDGYGYDMVITQPPRSCGCWNTGSNKAGEGITGQEKALNSRSGKKVKRVIGLK